MKLSKENFTESDKFRKAIHQLIPGGAHTYSKGDDQFPQLAPAAIAKGQGAYVWDIDGNKFLDCSMGLTSVSLGHAYEPVLEAVRAELLNGVNFQRPSVLEKEMAEKFLELIPIHERIKFCKNGSTATTAAVKLARAFTGREIVAFPSDHPFYSYDDWFISQKECSIGVPAGERNYSATFSSQDLGTLEQLFKDNPGKIACVITEPEKTNPHPQNYAQELISLCKKYGAVSIIDEMVTGFKTAFPGSTTKLGLEPDLCTWGKGIANGFSFCALTGKKEIMDLGGITNEGQEKLFLISTTHGGETHALAACLATIKEFKIKNVVEHNHQMGKLMIERCNQQIKQASLDNFIQVGDTPWMITFAFLDKNKESCPKLRTLFLQEMISRGVLFQGAFVPCFSHGLNDIELFMGAFSESLSVYANALEQGVEQFLVGKPTKPVFRKYI